MKQLHLTIITLLCISSRLRQSGPRVAGAASSGGQNSAVASTAPEDSIESSTMRTTVFPAMPALFSAQGRLLSVPPALLTAQTETDNPWAAVKANALLNEADQGRFFSARTRDGAGSRNIRKRR